MGVSIIFPHLIGEEQNRVLDLNLKMIKDNTVGEYEILTLATTRRHDLVYEGFNILAKIAKYESLLFTNTDILLAKNWDENLPKSNADWISFRVVECGAIGVDGAMINKDFGRTAATFDNEEFETFVSEERKDKPEFETGFVWYCPSIIKKSKFLELGGFGNEPNFPLRSHDIDFKLKAIHNKWTFQISNYSWAYHFQRANVNMGINPERV